jgi:hypothetical protein
MIHSFASRDVQNRSSPHWRPAVFAAKSANPVTSNHEVELATPAVQRKLRTLLAAPEHSVPDAVGVRFHLWGYHVPELLYAEHGNHYHDVNSFRRPLTPFHAKRTRATAGYAGHSVLGHARQKQSGGPPLHQVFADLLPVDRLVPRAVVDDYYARVLPQYAASIGLPVLTVRQLHKLGRTSTLATALRIAKVRLGHDLSFRDAAPGVATSVHRVLAAAGCPVPFCVFLVIAMPRLISDSRKGMANISTPGPGPAIIARQPAPSSTCRTREGALGLN